MGNTGEMNAIGLVIDRWHAGYLGCYGNAAAVTPALDRLACESFVFDQAIIDSADLATLYRSYWQGAHALLPAAAATNRPLPEALREAGVWTALVTDDPAVGWHPLASHFDERIDVPAGPAATAAEWEETQFARLMAAAWEWLATAREPFCLWIHAQGMAGAWDAPLEFRNQYAVDDDPVPPDLVIAPSREVAADADPDYLLGVRNAYAGQVSLVDACVSVLLKAIDEAAFAQRTAVAVLGARGFPLGEHRWIGVPDDGRPVTMHAELTHVPFFWRDPRGDAAGARSSALVQPADLDATLAALFGVARPVGPFLGRDLGPLVRDEVTELRPAVATARDHRVAALRTPNWLLTDAGLYVKPDDRWEVNDVADRCPEVAEGLGRASDDLAAAAGQSPPVEPPPLPDAVVTPVA